MCKPVSFALLMGAALFAGARGARAQDTRNFPVIGVIHRYDSQLDDLIPKDAKIEVLSSQFLSGPRVPCG